MKRRKRIKTTREETRRRSGRAILTNRKRDTRSVDKLHRRTRRRRTHDEDEEEGEGQKREDKDEDEEKTMKKNKTKE